MVKELYFDSQKNIIGYATIKKFGGKAENEGRLFSRTVVVLTKG
jgi:hypothetical protein